MDYRDYMADLRRETFARTTRGRSILIIARSTVFRSTSVLGCLAIDTELLQVNIQIESDCENYNQLLLCFK